MNILEGNFRCIVRHQCYIEYFIFCFRRVYVFDIVQLYGFGAWLQPLL